MKDQSLIAALSDPGFYPHRPERVEHLTTHISDIFLAGPYAYKLKKPVAFPFLDFTTLEQRQHFCQEEIRLNRRLCPTVYLDVLPITRDDRGTLRLGGAGTIVDHVVRMRRLPARGMLGPRIQEHRLPADSLDRLAHTLAAFHAAAPDGPGVARYGAPDALAARWEANMQVARTGIGSLLAPEDYEVLADFGPRFLHDNADVLKAREDQGRIRDGHGDLHCDNVCIVDEHEDAQGFSRLEPGIYVFDCIEFSDALRCNDVASEIAFLAMDLKSLGRPDLAQQFVATYTAAADDAMIPVLLPFYACYRACVRAKVESLMLAQAGTTSDTNTQTSQRAREHYALAVRYAWGAHAPTVIACTGLSGTGKTTVAEILSQATGFERISSDTIRRTITPTPPGPATDLYTPARRMGTYDTLLRHVEDSVAAHRSVIADATFIALDTRVQLGEVARRHRCPHVFVECTADESTVRARLEARDGTGSESDARWDTHCAQRQDQDPFEPDEPRLVVDTGGELRATRSTAIRALWHWRQGTSTTAAATSNPHQARGSA
jgi:aminoglycoside phosphotransferase family enzyme/predicted kinase